MTGCESDIFRLFIDAFSLHAHLVIFMTDK